MFDESPSLELEGKFLSRHGVVGGLDEVGRGALAGPVVVGVVTITQLDPPPAGLADSKVLTATQRVTMEPALQGWCSEWSLGAASAEEIDRWGLRIALSLASERALAALQSPPGLLLVDGNLNLLKPSLDVPFGCEPPPPQRFRDLPVVTVVKGDQKSATIAAAAVLAKVARDRQMVALAEEYPGYQWEGNKGYGAPQHFAALRSLGPTELHRRSWNLGLS